MKKRGLVDTIVKAGILAATVGGTLYLFRDKIEENPACKEAIDKIKDMVNKKTNPDISEEDFDMTDDLDDLDDILESDFDSDRERGYVKIKLPGDETDF